MQPVRRSGFDLYTPRTGHPDWTALEREANAIVDAVRPQLAAPRSLLADSRRRARSYATAAANYRVNRAMARAGREDLRPLYFIWTTLRSCNFDCAYCDDHRGRKYPDLCDDGVLTTEQGERLLEVMRTRTPSVYFAGGEPTMRKDLPRLLLRWHCVTAAGLRCRRLPRRSGRGHALLGRRAQRVIRLF